MRILFGVQATGNGHISRARAFAQAFAQHPDVEVDWLFSGRDRDGLFDMDSFGDFQCLQGLTFHTRNGRITPLQTARQANLQQLFQDIRDLSLDSYDLVMSDFEPVTAWAARQQNKTSIAVSHQAAFLHDIPKPRKTPMQHGIMNYYAPTEINLGVHWHHFDQPILPPVLEHMPQNELDTGEHVLVYLPFEDITKIQRVLQNHCLTRFVCFHPGISEPQQLHNVLWRPLSRKQFMPALAQSRGVIANAGFELPSEALAMGKPLLVKPLKGQFEQEGNALALAQLGLASTMPSLDSHAIDLWLDKPSQGPVHWPDVPMAVIDWLKQGNWQDIQPLVTQLWQETESYNQPLRRAA